MSVQLPIDHLDELWPEQLRGARVGAVLHPASVSHDSSTARACWSGTTGNLLKLAAFFGPQHGFLGQTQDNMIEWQGYEHPRLGIPVYSLYGEHREPTPEMLRGLDVMLVDLQDIGTRYYTFIWTLYLVMKACEAAGVHVVVCDTAQPDQRRDHRRAAARSRLSFVRRTASAAGAARRARSANSRSSFATRRFQIAR